VPDIVLTTERCNQWTENKSFLTFMVQGHLKVIWRIKSSDGQDINCCIFFIFPDEQLLEGKNMSDETKINQYGKY